MTIQYLKNLYLIPPQSSHYIHLPFPLTGTWTSLEISYFVGFSSVEVDSTMYNIIYDFFANDIGCGVYNFESEINQIKCSFMHLIHVY